MKSLSRSLLVGLVLRLALLLVYEGDIGDPTSRTQATLEWLAHPHPLFGVTTWGPLNYLLPALAIKIGGGEAFWSVRILYVLIGTATIALLYAATASALDAASAEVAALLLAINPYHITHSANGSTSEIPAIACVLIGLTAICRYRRDPSPGWLLLGALAVNLGSLVRYDGAIWGALFGATLLLPSPRGAAPQPLRQRIVVACVFWALAGVATACLAWQWYRATGNPVFGLARVDRNVRQFFDGGAYVHRSMLTYQAYAASFYVLSGVIVLSPVVWGLGVLGAWRGIQARRGLEVVIPAVAVAGWLTLETLRHVLTPHFRFALVLDVLLLAFVRDGVTALRERWPGVRVRTIAQAAAASVVGTYAVVAIAAVGQFGAVTRQLIWISPVRVQQYASRPVVAWMRAHLTVADRVVVLPCVNSPYLLLATPDLVATHQLDILSYYADDTRALTRAEMVMRFSEHRAGATYVLGNTDCREVGWRDGPGPDLLSAPADGGATVAGEGPLVPMFRSGPLQLFAFGSRR